MNNPAQDFRHVGDHRVHSGHVWSVVVADFESPAGPIQRDVVRSPGSVGIVPVLFDPEGVASVVLVEQYRPALDRSIVEIPAGMRDVADEPPEQTAVRELAEEVGLTAERIEHLVTIAPSPGMTDATSIIYVATGCTQCDRNAQGPEEQAMSIRHLPLADAVRMVTTGEIIDAKTVVALLLVERRIQEL